MEQIANSVHRTTDCMILAIDPGTTESGWVLYDDKRVEDSGVMDNRDLIEHMRSVPDYGQKLAIEMIASYGMPVGREVFETCVWVGRFMEAWHSPEDVRLVYRKDVKLHLCGTPRAKDANVRQALIDLFGGKEKAVGKKALPGPLYGVKSHAWPALGVAVTVAHQMNGGV
ncbi:hypothetical protein KDW54_06905 [Burkholderia ambifaria]|uniref:hypothetical protein n=1 Tax=Burkholderia ambifaria TaxID=152480 RepID=UPI001BA3A427|nr:hypothetical protein [Burkholderia ambifaria]MBR8182125.1 hypothetical protein [Burkholderia ambifaria]